jgi:hypothetical protein
VARVSGGERWARIVRRIAEVEYRLHDRMRPRAAFGAARQRTIVGEPSVLGDKRTCSRYLGSSTNPSLGAWIAILVSPSSVSPETAE